MIWIDKSIEYMLALEANKKENQKLSFKNSIRLLLFVYDIFTTLCHQTISKYETV